VTVALDPRESNVQWVHDYLGSLLKDDKRTGAENDGNSQDNVRVFEKIWGFPKMVGFPNKPMGFPTKNDHFGVFWGYHHFRKPPYVRF